MTSLRRRLALATLSLPLLLAACASTPPQATVQVYGPAPALAAGTTYRIDRLPSQVGQPGQAALEAAADAQLQRAGLRRDDAGARMAVQLVATQDAVAGRGVGGPSVGVGLGAGNWGSGVGIGLGFPIGGSGVQRSTQRVEVVLRDLAGGRVLWQAQASGDASPAALADAALREFPGGAPGTRTVPLAAR